MLVKLVIIFFLTGFIQCLNICGDWTQYKDIKCIKVLKKKATEEEALGNCAQLDSDAGLVTIHSRDEQEFLNNLLKGFNDISVYSWLGMKYISSTYKWMDGTSTNYTNWADDALKDGSEPCVQMSLVNANLGKWLDESCKRTALIVCQKKQVFTLNTLREALEALEKKVEVPAIPMGFLYTQLPDQSAPEELWPQLNWTEVTDKYAGLFFRAEGNITAPFGQIQHANQSIISAFKAQGQSGNNYSPIPEVIYSAKTGWTTIIPKYNSYNAGFLSFGVHMTTGEVRPTNTAIRIWKRVE